MFDGGARRGVEHRALDVVGADAVGDSGRRRTLYVLPSDCIHMMALTKIICSIDNSCSKSAGTSMT